MDVGLSGRTLTSPHVEYTVTLQLSDGYLIRIESPFTLTLGNRTFDWSPDNHSATSFEPVTQLIGQVISESTVDDTGALTVVFDSGDFLQVESDANYEAWTIAGPGGMLIVCSPGGELSIWHADESSDTD